MAELPLILRSLRSDDEPFIFTSWLHAHATYRDFRVAKDIYYQEQHALIRELLGQDRFIVAADPAVPSLIFGWLAGDELSVGRILDYVFVKPAYRRMGIAMKLLKDFGPVDAFTHWSPVAEKLVPGAVYDPYLLSLQRRKGVSK